jgi:predicted membrane-bound mannosyltransferase
MNLNLNFTTMSNRLSTNILIWCGGKALDGDLALRVSGTNFCSTQLVFRKFTVYAAGTLWLKKVK